MMRIKPVQTDFKIITVAGVFDSYPNTIRKKLLFLRQLILVTASEVGVESKLEETLKRGESSYLTIRGSTIRIGWKKIKARTIRYVFPLQNQAGRYVQGKISRYIQV